MTSYFNNSIPLFPSSTSVSDLTTTVDQLVGTVDEIQGDIAPDMAQNFKSVSGVIANPLIEGTYVQLTGSDLISLLPGQWTLLSDLNYQYIGANASYFLIAWSVSGAMTPARSVTFAIHHNTTILPASAQVQHFLAGGIYGSTSGFIIHLIEPNDTIQLMANLLALDGNVNFNLENVNLLITKVAASAI